MRKNKHKILWVSIPENVLEQDEKWIHSTQKRTGDPEQSVRNFVLRHPEVLKHTQIMPTISIRKMKLLGVELGLTHPDQHNEHPDLLFRLGRTYYVVEAKTEMSSEPELRRIATRQREALKHTLEIAGEPFDSIIPVVAVGNKFVKSLRSRYHDSPRLSLEEPNKKKIEYHPRLFRDALADRKNKRRLGMHC